MQNQIFQARGGAGDGTRELPQLATSQPAVSFKSMNSFPANVDRISKYAKKLDAERIGKRYDATREIAIKKVKAAMPQQLFIEGMVKNVCNGVSTVLLPYYIIFGKEVEMLKGKHASASLINEMEILQWKWGKRGLDIELMNEIKTRLVEAYVPFGYFRFDQSLLDGPDVLA